MRADRERAGRVKAVRALSGGKTQLPLVHGPSTRVRGDGGGVQKFSHYSIHGWGSLLQERKFSQQTTAWGASSSTNKHCVYVCVCVGALNTEEQRAGKVRSGQYGKA